MFLKIQNSIFYFLTVNLIMITDNFSQFIMNAFSKGKYNLINQD